MIHITIGEAQGDIDGRMILADNNLFIRSAKSHEI